MVVVRLLALVSSLDAVETVTEEVHPVGHLKVRLPLLLVDVCRFALFVVLIDMERLDLSWVNSMLDG